MIKKILKLAVILLAAGAIATPALAAEWGVSGQVRVDWDVSKTIEQKAKTEASGDKFLPEGDGGGKKRIPAGVALLGGDSWVSFDLKGDNASGSFLYYANGGQDYVGSGSAKVGSWSANANIAVINSLSIADAGPRIGDFVAGTKPGDNTVEIKHDGGFSLKLGLTTPLDSYRRGQGYLLIGETGGSAHVTEVATGANLDALDNRSNVAQLGYAIGDVVKIGVTFEAADSKDQLGGKAFQSIKYGIYESAIKAVVAKPDATPPVKEVKEVKDVGAIQAGLGNLGINVNLNLGIANIGLVVVNAAENSDPDLGKNDTNYKASASAVGLGIGVNLGSIVPYFNLWSPSSTSENDLGKDETASSATQIGVGIALGENSGVGLSLVNRASTYNNTPKGETKSKDTKTETSSFELGYATKLGGADFKVAFDSATFKYTDDGDKDANEEVAVTWIKLRLQQGF